jgi:hypothetical protein
MTAVCFPPVSSATGCDDEGDNVAADLRDFRVERARGRKRGHHMVITPESRSDEKQQPRQAATLVPLQRFGVVTQCAALLAACALLEQCSAVPVESAAAPPPPSNYGMLANAVKGFKSFASYSDFEISAPRWVHAETGWNWLVCLRYEDHGQRRYYAVFFQGDSVVNSRYDVITDRCRAQQYVPIDLTTGTIKSPPPVPQQPIH